MRKKPKPFKAVTYQLRQDIHQLTGLWITDRADRDALVAALRRIVDRADADTLVLAVQRIADLSRPSMAGAA
jgi:hypothetical protein